MAGGIPASSGGTHLRELVPAVRELWKGDYAHDGEIWQFPTSTSAPKPIQQPTPPMWIAASHPEVPRPELMVLRHTHVHGNDEPDGWLPAAQAIARFYRTFDAWFGNKATPKNGFLDPSPESKFEGRPEFEPEALHKTAMIGTPDEVIARLRYYEELGVDEFSFWCDNSLPHEEKNEVPCTLHR